MEMKSNRLANSSLEVTQLAFGCWGITSDFHWGDRDEKESTNAIRAAIDQGVDFFDTAEVYGAGESETLLGKALASCRDQVVIASKVLPDSMTAEKVIEGCERSLQRLKIDVIDLYQLHWAHPDVPVQASWGAMMKLKAQGKVKEIGVCNFGVEHLSEICSMEKPISNQLPYNLIWRAIEHEIVPKCQAENISILAYSPLMHGLIGDKYATAADVPDGRARSRHFNTERSLARHGEEGCEVATFEAIDSIRQIAAEIGRSTADLALAWVAAQPGVGSVIAGAKNAQQLEQNVATLGNPLPDSAVEQLSAATAAVNEILGPNPDMWQGKGGGRYK